MTTSHFCWVRLVDVNADAKRTKVDYFYGEPDSWLKYGSRPPGVVESSGRTGALGVWSAPSAVFGREGADTVFEYGPAFATSNDAVTWLTSADGHEWDKFALNRFLMSFTGVVPPVNNRPNCGTCSGTFPDSHWAEEFRFKHRREPSRPLFRHGDLCLNPLADYIGGLDECHELRRLSNDWETARVDIYKEAHSPIGAIVPIMNEAGLATDGAAVTPEQAKLKALRDWVLSAIEPSIYKFKVERCRARPWTDCSGLKATFADPTHKCYPGHPSFPSGHATLAYVFAYLIGHRRPYQLAQLEQVAAAIAKRREVAGVHFPSDTAAGKHLARQMVDLMVNKDTNPNWTDFNTMLSLLD